MIEVENLVKTFGRTTAVAGISLHVRQGEVVGFLGPNGAGKTTTIRILTGFHPADSGRARVAGFDVLRQSLEVRRRIGYLPENVPLYPDLRVQEYLTYRAALKGVPRAQRRSFVEAAMEQCGVLEVRRKLVGHVSRGYRQRVGLADALVARPPILILDEPTSGLDPNQRRRMKDLIRNLAEQHTVLFSSHILSEVQDVSSRILVIHNGTLRADGTPEQLMQQAAGRLLRVTAAIEKTAMLEAIATVDGLIDPQVESVGDGYYSVQAAVAPDVDPRDAVAAAFSARGARFRELRLDLPTLEEFFRQVTEGADAAVAAEEAAVIAEAQR